MGLGAERELGLDSERRGSTAASVSYSLTSADMSMVGGGWVVLRSMDRVLTVLCLQ